MDALDYDVCAFSVDGRFLAAAVSDRLFVRKRPFAAAGPWAVVAANRVDRLQWNGTSERVLCAHLGGGGGSLLQVYDVRAAGWTHTVRCGYFGFADAEWMGRAKILLTLQFRVALAVFDLSDGSTVYVETPKPYAAPSSCVVAFDSRGTRMYVVSKTNGREKLLIVRAPRTLDGIVYVENAMGPCESLSKSPDDRFLCAYNRRKLTVLNFSSGRVVGSVTVPSLLNTVSWSRDGQHLALGCSSGTVIVLDSAVDFNVKFLLCPSHSVVGENYDFFVQSNKLSLSKKSRPSGDFVRKVPAAIDSVAWSHDCLYLSAFGTDSNFLCVWKTFRLACVIEFASPIKTMLWCPSKNRLSVVFGTDVICFWAENRVPELQTSPKLVDGRRLLTSGICWSVNNEDMILSDGKKSVLFSSMELQQNHIYEYEQDV